MLALHCVCISISLLTKVLGELNEKTSYQNQSLLYEKCEYPNKKKNADNSSRGYKTFFMLNSSEHEILNAHKFKELKRGAVVE